MAPTSLAPSARSKLLIVDDDALQLHALAQAVRRSRRGVSVTMAGSAPEAIQWLQKSPVDVVLSDLQLPAMDGFELIDWMLKNTPQIPVFAMTAHWSPNTEDKLASLGGVECYIKPLDVTSIMGRIDEVLAAGVRGHIQNMSAPSLLQIISMDRKTCTLLMSTGDKSGHLFIQKGELVDARSGHLRGESAALAILSWPFPTITIDSRCKFTERTINRPLTYIIMESMRLADEQARLDEAAPLSSGALSNRGSILPSRRSEAPPSGAALSAPGQAPARRAAPSGAPQPQSVEPPRASIEGQTDAARNSDVAAARIARTSLATMKALGLALVDTSGRMLSAAVPASVDMAAMAHLASNMLLELRAAQSRQAGSQRVEEFVFMASDSCHLVKPFASRQDAFVLLVFNPRETSLATRRTALEELVKTLEE
jgi:CheY-like chemotaxis protein